VTNFDLQLSATYQVIANLLRHIEGLGFPKSDWCIYDSGQTLEVTTELYNQISNTAEFRAFESIGGSSSLEDNNPYLPEARGHLSSSDRIHLQGLKGALKPCLIQTEA
jgi:hypothetical protein